MVVAAQVSWLVCKMCDLEFRTDQLVRKHLRGSGHRTAQHTPAVPAVCYKPTLGEAASGSASAAVTGGLSEHIGAAAGIASVDGVDVKGGDDDVSRDRGSVTQTHGRAGAGDRPYACEDCGQAFSRPSDLTTHRRTHTGERPYACDVGGKGDKPYACDVCGQPEIISNYCSNLTTYFSVT